MHAAPQASTRDPMYLTSREVDYSKWSDALAIFTPFADEPWAMLLDSAASEHQNSRYDIIVRQPLMTLTRRHAQSPNATPFAELSQCLAKVPAYRGTHALPFTGGALGYLGYDAGRWCETITPAARALPVDAASSPRHDSSQVHAAEADIVLADIALGFYQHAIVIDHHAKRSFILGPETQLQTGDWEQQVADFWQPIHRLGEADFYLTAAWQSNMSEADYHTRIGQIKAHLNAGDCYQINLAQRFCAPYTGSTWQAYQALREANRAPFSAYLNVPDGQVLSLSPERFIQSSSTGKVQTKPIKGTRPRAADPVQDELNLAQLQQSGKDQAENLMIVDLLRNDLSRTCLPNSVRVPKLFSIESFAAVHHLVSTIEGQLADPLDSVALLQAAFPGGSITGAPKVSAMQIIESLEPHRRSVYCGSIGYINQDGSCDTNIAIRTLVACQQHLYCWAGGGIVLDSDAAAEYQETFDKVKRIVPLLTALNRGHRDKPLANTADGQPLGGQRAD